MERIQMNATEGLKLVTEIVTTRWISETTGINYYAVSRCLHNSMAGGKVFYFNEDQIRKINDAIIIMSSSIQHHKFLADEKSFQELKGFGKRIKLNYLFQNIMGKTQRWQKMHMSEVKEFRYYGKFTEQEIIDINLALIQMGAKLGSIELVCDKPE